MAKIVRTTDDSYGIIVAKGGTITLDTTNAGQDVAVAVTKLIVGVTYIIESVGTTDFTLIGANDNNVGTEFIATGQGTGTGIAAIKFPGSGSVVVKGNLEVKGTTTTVESTVATISDNILLLNEGNTFNGLPSSLDRPYSSGIEIDRGLGPNARWVYDDSISWALGGNTGSGTWVATKGPLTNETVLPLRTDGIVSAGTLYVSTGNGVISVTGTNDYEEKIWRYVGGLVEADPVTGEIIQDDDNIPNAKAVKDYVDYSIATVEIDRLVEDNSSIVINDKNNIIASIFAVGSNTTLQTVGSHGYSVGDSIKITGVSTSPVDAIINGLNGEWTVTEVPLPNQVKVSRSTSGGDPNAYIFNSGRAYTDPNVDPDRITVTVDNSEIVNFYQNRVELAGIQILGEEISTWDSNQDLVLSAPGTGTVKIKDTLELTKTPGDDEGLTFDPLSPQEGVKIYSKTIGNGKTGIYFVNENDYRDEIISKNRALLYGMLF